MYHHGNAHLSYNNRSRNIHLIRRELPECAVFVELIVQYLYIKYIIGLGFQCLCIESINSCPNACSDLNFKLLLHINLLIIKSQFVIP